LVAKGMSPCGSTARPTRWSTALYFLKSPISRRQCRELDREDSPCQNPLKSIDEYNYCKHRFGILLRIE